MPKTAIAAFLLTALFAVSCSNPMPKPYGYFRIDLPPNSYRMFDSIYPPCTFEVSEYAKVIPQYSQSTQERGIDIAYPQQNGRIYCSYVRLNGDFAQISEESRSLAYKHTVRADAIMEDFFEYPDAKVYGILYQIKGNAASPMQFVVTDSTRHFLRGALYFNASPNADSIAPVAEYIEKDLRHLIETIEWK